MDEFPFVNIFLQSVIHSSSPFPLSPQLKPIFVHQFQPKMEFTFSLHFISSLNFYVLFSRPLRHHRCQGNMSSTLRTAQKERLPAELEMSWANYLIPVFTSSMLMFSCWLIGHFQCSLLWIFLFVALYVLKTRTWIRREQKRISLRNMILRERETVMAQYSHRDDLPAWVQFPDIERIEWVNKIIQQLWPYIGEYTKIFLHEFIEPQIRAQLPSPFKSFKFVSVDMGDIPFRVSGLKVYTQNVGRDKVIMDMDLVYAGDAEFVVQACGFRGGLNQLVLTGKLRTILQPLLPHPPMVGGVAGAFIELPKFDFNLTGMGEFVQLPGLIDAIRSVVNAQMANLAVLPNKIVVPLAPHVDVSRLYFPEPDGVIRLKLIEAMNLENKDWNFIKKDISDPYCEVQVGSQIFRTKVINNNLNPIFNECFEAIVDQASGQKLRIELFDKDTAGADEELGRLTIPLDIVRQAGEIEKWYHLEGCKHGELRLKICWLDLSTNSNNPSQNDHQWENEWMSVDKQMHSALLMVYVNSINNLPYPKSNLEPSPFVELSMGRITQRSPVKLKTVNPLFQSKFNFFIKNPEGQQEELRIRAIDEGTRKEIGELIISLSSVLREPGLEFNQQTFYLQHGVHSCPILLTLRLRFFTQPKNLLENHEKTYGTAAHIERGGSNLIAKDSTRTMMKNGEAETTCPEAGKIVNNNNEEKNEPELKLNAHNSLGIHHRSTRRPSTTNSEHTISSSRSSKKSKADAFLDKLIGVKHAKKRKPQRSIAPSSAGKIQIGLNYDQQKHKLMAKIIAVTDLQPIEKDGHADPFVTIKLFPNSGGHSTNMAKSRRRHTKIIRNSLDPIFDEKFEFDIPFTELHNYKLQLAVKDSINYGLFSIKQPTLGMVVIQHLNLGSMKIQWLDLISPQK